MSAVVLLNEAGPALIRAILEQKFLVRGTLTIVGGENKKPRGLVASI
jgi:hypothetical protein